MPLPPEFEKSLFEAADLMRSNTGLEPSEYTQPVLALLFLRFADLRFKALTATFAKQGKKPEPIDYKSRRVPWLPETGCTARWAQTPGATYTPMIGRRSRR